MTLLLPIIKTSDPRNALSFFSDFMHLRDFLYQLDCPFCSATGNWKINRHPILRSESLTSLAQCRNCHYRIFVKKEYAGKQGKNALEYHALRLLWDLFPQDQHFGTIKPISKNMNGTIMVLEHVDGVPASRTLSQAGTEQLHKDAPMIAKRAGAWLARFHCTVQADTGLPDLDVKSQVIHELWSNTTTIPNEAQRCLAALAETAAALTQSSTRRAGVHGDFTPDNVLLGDEKTIGVDIGLRFTNAIAYDIAPFLNHIQLESSNRIDNDKRFDHEVEEKFLAGYGGISSSEAKMLAWLRLYFMLSYWRTHWGTSGIRRVLHWPSPKFSRLAGILREKLLKPETH